MVMASSFTLFGLSPFGEVPPSFEADIGVPVLTVAVILLLCGVFSVVDTPAHLPLLLASEIEMDDEGRGENCHTSF